MKYLISLFLSVNVCLGLDGMSLTGTNINLNGQSGWSVFTDSDSPESAYGHVTAAGVSNVVATITFPSTLSAGQWRFQLKAIDYDRWQTAFITFGDGTNSAPVSDRDNGESRWLPNAVPITSSYGTNRITINFQTTNAADARIRFLVVYATTNIYEDVSTGNDLIWLYQWNTITNTTVDTSENLFRNSSFEINSEFWRPSVYDRSNSLTSWITSSDSFHGANCFIFNEQCSMYSTPFYPKPNRRYTLSLYSKGNGSVGIEATVNAPAGSGYSNTLSQSVNLPNIGIWARTNVTMVLKDYPVGMPYRFRVFGNAGSKVDAIMIEEGSSASTFSLRNDLEMGWLHPVRAGVYYSGGTNSPEIKLYNDGGSSSNITVFYEWIDDQNAVVTNGTRSVTVNSGSTNSVNIALPYKYGWFRGMAWVTNREPHETVIVYSPDLGVTSTNDFIGFHNYPRTWQVESTVRLGINLHRAMSPDSNLRWSNVETSDDVFNFKTDFYKLMVTTNNTVVMATLGAVANGNGTPAFGGTWSSTDVTQASNYVYHTVRHFGVTNNLIHKWELWNEPQQENMPLANYTNIQWRCAQAIKAADPTAIVVGMGGSSQMSYITPALDALGASLNTLIDEISIHGYPPASDPHSSGSAIPQAQGWKTNLIDVYGIPVMNSESGSPEWGGATVENQYLFIGSSVYKYNHQRLFFDGLTRVPNDLMKHATAYKAYEATQYYYYYGRSVTFNEWYDIEYGPWEPNDMVKPKIASLAFLNYKLADKTGNYVLPYSSTNVVFLYMEDGDDSVAVAWSQNGAYYTMTMTNVVPYTHYLNPITVTANQFNIGRFPVYLESDGINSGAFKSALTNSSISAASDTIAPGVSIYNWNNPVDDTNRFTAFWSVVDERDLPGKNEQLVLFTRSKISTDADYDEWSVLTTRTWSNVTNSFILYVQGKDLSNNTNTVTRYFNYSDPAPPESPSHSVIRNAVLRNATIR